ncbi:MAG: acyl-CoA thioesterase [Actinobacteria bacterium]|nr:acyl-CoA thioesterase [Actinomycetota bacterium]
MEGFPFVYREPVRFRDLDAMEHVNNAVFLTYLEEARTAFLRERGLVTRLEDLGMVVARAEIDFRSTVAFGETVDIGVRASRFGTKSFELEYRLESAGRLAAEAKTVCVGFDYETRSTVPVPEAWRKLLSG